MRKRRLTLASRHALLALAVSIAGAVFGANASFAQAAPAAVETIVISGASGQLGGEVVEALLGRGVPAADLILVTRTPEKLSRYGKLGASVRYGDFDKPESLGAAFAGGTQLLLISTVASPRRLQQQLAAIEAAKQAGVKRIVYTSIVAADRLAKAGVLADHFATEQALAASGLGWTVLRNQTYAESQLEEASIAIAAGEYQTNQGRGSVAYVAHRDCAESAAAALTTAGHDGRIYDITGPDLVNPDGFVRALGDLSGKRIKVFALLDDEYRDQLKDYGMPEEVAILLAALNKAAREGLLSVRSDDVEQLTGHKPKSLREVFEEHRATLLEDR